MSAVWRAARAAIRRRKLQTFLIALVVLLCGATTVVSLALLDASSAPFDRAFAARQGAHSVAAYDPGRVTEAQLSAARSGVTAAAGPFAQVVLEPEHGTGRLPMPGPITVVGRADPGGAVDRLDLWRGRWPSAPGEIVLAFPPDDDVEMGPLAGLTEVAAGGVTLKVVGFADSISESADGWVTPEQARALHPTGWQMLYRFAGDVSTREAVAARQAGVATGLPGGALIAAEPYLALKEEAAQDLGTYLPLLGAFGVFGLLVAVLIVANVVSGAVVSGYRHIGVLKSIGFTPRQVVAVYLLMASVPAVAGAVPGAVIGALGGQGLIGQAFRGFGFGDTSIRWWVWLAALLGVPLLVLVAALVPARRAHRLSAAQAISAGSAQRRGRGLRAQRALSGSRLPRAVSLGLGLPFARPGRTALTMAALLLGVTTVTFATGLGSTLNRVTAIDNQVSGDIGVRGLDPAFGAPTTRTDARVEELLRGLPGAARVGVFANTDLSVPGGSDPLPVNFARGEVAELGYRAQLLRGHWMTAPDEVVAPSKLLLQRGWKVGDPVTVESGGRRTTFRIVGETVRGPSGPPALLAEWAALVTAIPDPHLEPSDFQYQVQVTPGTDLDGYVAAVRSADSGLDVWNNVGTDDFAVIVTGFSTVLGVLLALVASLGVLNTVALDALERRRDLGMLKSIGMTPRQVVTMMVTSMAALGVIGGLLGLPLGIAVHRVVVAMVSRAAQAHLPTSVVTVWTPALLVPLVLTGVLIAVAGALFPARSAARLTIARVLHNE
ncbi:ABC transporter permease [Actinoplanes oblitus]|uniref:ABC transporter permease n=1 Tax=Actinoplanes oblitus TaxID=3040509 RepID=A0ABY8WN55_9ACTN|nr:ABC transporter permease [Actinoplanes oblitus]WIM99265.1 ABC transporter permease [Actinoplanes oblitus]